MSPKSWKFAFQSMTTAGLRKLLHDPNTLKGHKNSIYAELLRRKKRS